MNRTLLYTIITILFIKLPITAAYNQHKDQRTPIPGTSPGVPVPVIALEVLRKMQKQRAEDMRAAAATDVKNHRKPQS